MGNTTEGSGGVVGNGRDDVELDGTTNIPHGVMESCWSSVRLSMIVVVVVVEFIGIIGLLLVVVVVEEDCGRRVMLPSIPSSAAVRLV